MQLKPPEQQVHPHQGLGQGWFGCEGNVWKRWGRGQGQYGTKCLLVSLCLVLSRSIEVLKIGAD